MELSLLGYNLPRKGAAKIIRASDPGVRYHGRPCSRSIRYHAMERSALMRQRRGRYPNGPQCTGPTVPDVLAPNFRICFRNGFSIEDAQDLTQDFFVMVLDGHLLGRADPHRGRFRSLLLKALKDFLNDARDKKRARKRGGDVQFIRWDEWMAEMPSAIFRFGQRI